MSNTKDTLTKDKVEIKKEEVAVEAAPKEETATKVVETKKLTKEELKAKFRGAEMAYRGRLFVDDKYKKPDKVLRIDNDDAATRQYLAGLGYVPVLENIVVGSGSLNEAHGMGSEVRVEQGVSFSQPGILYEIDKDLYDARKEIESEDNDAQLKGVMEANASESQKQKMRN